MKILSLILVVAAGVSGCAKTPQYEAVFSLPGASPGELDETVARVLLGLSEVEVVRTVARSGELRAYLRSGISESKLEGLLSDHKELPFDVSLTSLTRLQAGLPPRPEIVQEPHLVVTIDHKRAGALGVTSADLATLRPLGTADLKSARAFVVRTKQGKQVPLSSIGEVRVEYEPSHIVRDYGVRTIH